MKAIRSRPSVTEPYVTGSTGLTWKRREDTSRMTISAATRPKAMPMPVRMRPWRINYSGDG